MNSGNSLEQDQHSGHIRWKELCVVCAVLAAFLILMLMSQSRISWTIDEMRWINAGRNVMRDGWSDHPDELCHPVLFMLSQAASRAWFSDGSQDSDVTSARMGMLPYVIAGLLILFFWSRSINGFAGGLFSLLLLAFSPTFLAHARLATSDAMLSTAVLAAAAAFALQFKKPSGTGGLLLSAAFAFGFLSKFSFILVPVLLLPAVLFRSRRPVRALVTSWILPLAAGLLVLNAVYGFQGTGRPLISFRLVSGAFQKLSATWLGLLPLPLPERYIRGMDNHLAFAGSWPSYLFGSVSVTGFPGYDLIAWAVKTTLPALILILTGLIFLKRLKPSVDERIVIYIAAGWLLYFSFIHRVDCGVRYILPVYPLLFLIAGRTARIPGKGFTRGVFWGSALIVVHGVITLARYPFYIGYFNELAGGRGDLVLGDSNLSWTQELKELARYQREHAIDRFIFGIEVPLAVLDPYIRYRPISHREKYVPGSGDYAVWIASLQSLLHRDPNAFLWFRLLEPDAVIGDAAYVYHVDLEPGRELAFFREAVRSNRKNGFRFPGAESCLDNQDGMLFFPLTGLPENENWEEIELQTHDAPPSRLITMNPPVSGSEISVCGYRGDERIETFLMDVELAGQSVFYLPVTDEITRLIVQKQPTGPAPETISLAYELESRSGLAE
ncbi:glycosyltransferase family 39 protein [bacterium]|nr:glycosyltransferase family 39 protein [candidate division CSSED10-310 bacterium]